MDGKEIFFHVGLGKVASTFLQQQFFPKLKGIHYVPTNHYRYVKKIIPRIKDSRILVSREFDVQLEEQLNWFTETFPEPQVVILLRRHDDWIASQYRRFVKNGFSKPFEMFIEPEKDQGYWRRHNLFYYPMIRLIEKITGKKPVVLSYEDLKQSPEKFLRNLANHLSADFEPNEIDHTPVHTSFSDKQLKILRSFTRFFRLRLPRTYHNRLKNWLLFRPVWGLYHLILYAAKLVPEGWSGNQPLIDPEALERVRSYYAEDWEQVNQYNNP